MKNLVSMVVLLILVGFFLSCTSKAKAYMPLSDIPNAQVLGELTAIFESPHALKGLSTADQQMANQSVRALTSGNAQAGLIGVGAVLGVAATKDVRQPSHKKNKYDEK